MQQPNAWGQQPPPQQRQQVDPFGPLGAQVNKQLTHCQLCLTPQSVGSSI